FSIRAPRAPPAFVSTSSTHPGHSAHFLFHHRTKVHAVQGPFRKCKIEQQKFTMFIEGGTSKPLPIPGIPHLGALCFEVNIAKPGGPCISSCRFIIYDERILPSLFTFFHSSSNIISHIVNSGSGNKRKSPQFRLITGINEEFSQIARFQRT